MQFELIPLDFSAIQNVYKIEFVHLLKIILKKIPYRGRFRGGPEAYENTDH
ncbi:MAG: hypothetical protein JWR54_192 [Mucilaginibacter sp.]|jgi:hypothetical protein|nr:hypothetical protein [Mucilaginibacter sp.]